MHLKTIFPALVFLHCLSKSMAQNLAVPEATNLDENVVNTVTFPFAITGGFAQEPPGAWEAGKSTIKASFELSYKRRDQSGMFGQKMERTAIAGINGQWKMEGFSMSPPPEAFDVEYTLFIFHYTGGKESLGKAYRIAPDSKYIKKYGTIKLAKKPALFVKPIPRSEMIRRGQKINWVKLNPQPIPPKSVIKSQIHHSIIVNH